MENGLNKQIKKIPWFDEKIFCLEPLVLVTFSLFVFNFFYIYSENKSYKLTIRKKRKINTWADNKTQTDSTKQTYTSPELRKARTVISPEFWT